MKNIVLCADDYGQAATINQGILLLLARKRLSAVSCLVTADNFAECATLLRPYAPAADIGLHFNLTQGKPLSSAYRKRYGSEFAGLKSLMLRSIFGQLDKQIILAELVAQLEQFQLTLGFLPNFIDGHQHIHQFPLIRASLVLLHQQLMLDKNFYIRWVRIKGLPWQKENLKAKIIQAMGTKAMGKLLCAQQISHNQSFAGIYNFSKDISYAEIFPKFLQQIEDQGIILCHPAAGLDADDAISEQRVAEFNYFCSQKFNEDCHKNDIRIARFKHNSAPC